MGWFKGVKLMEIQLTRTAKEELTKIMSKTSSSNIPRLFIAGYG
jgi:Fe-S cluster assembly iron-binding protein IscA